MIILGKRKLTRKLLGNSMLKPLIIWFFKKKVSIGSGFHYNQAKAAPKSTESQDQMIKQVELGAATGWLEWKAVLTPVLSDKIWHTCSRQLCAFKFVAKFWGRNTSESDDQVSSLNSSAVEWSCRLHLWHRSGATRPACTAR